MYQLYLNKYGKKRIKAMRLLHSKKNTKQTNKQRKGNIHPNTYKIKFHKKCMYVSVKPPTSAR